MKYLVAQIGARRHYAIPRMLHEAGILSDFYTDICAVKSWPRLLNHLPSAMRPAGLKRLLGRVPNGVPLEKITAFTKFGWEYHRRLNKAATTTEVTRSHLWAGTRFCELILDEGLDCADGVYTFNSAGLELMAEAKKRGLKVVMEQTIAPREIEMKLLKEERERFPDWAFPVPEDGSIFEFVAREHAEWVQADLILCGSEFVREGIAACGGPVEKCRVVPYGVDAKFVIAEREVHAGPLRVLTVGAVGLRKGSPYVLEAARQLKGVAEFRMAGSLNGLPVGQIRLPENLELLGVVPRSEVLRHFAWADVFLLPSLCEGSATAVYEALSAGMPVVCTPNTGSVVRHGVEGYIVPVSDDQAIVDALITLARDYRLRKEMSFKARERADLFTLAQYRNRLISAIK